MKSCAPHFILRQIEPTVCYLHLDGYLTLLFLCPRFYSELQVVTVAAGMVTHTGIVLNFWSPCGWTASTIFEAFGVRSRQSLLI